MIGIFQGIAWPGLWVIVFILLGLWYGHSIWYRWARRLRVLREEGHFLKVRRGNLRARKLSGEPSRRRVKRKEPSVKPPEAAVSSSLDFLPNRYDKAPPTPDDLTRLEGVDSSLQSELNEAGVYHFQQLRELNSEQRKRLESHFALPEFVWAKWEETWSGDDASIEPIRNPVIEREFPTESVTADPALGVIYLGDPSHVDDLREIRGIGPAIEQKLHDHGVFCFRQIAHWSDENVRAFSERLGCFPDRIRRDEWVEQANRFPCDTPPEEIDLERILSQNFEGESRAQIDPKFGIIYTDYPDEVDDLKMIRGIGDSLEKELHDLGIYRFKQIAHWNRRTVEEVSHRFQRGKIERDRWIPQARELAKIAEDEQGPVYKAPHDIDFQARLARDFAGERAGIDPSIGIVYEEEPDVVDDLERIHGVSPESANQLRQLGIYRFKQVASWSDSNVTTVAAQLEIEREQIEKEKWIPQARRLNLQTYRANSEWGSTRPSLSEYEEKITAHFPGEEVRADDDLGIIYPTQPPTSDELTAIDGIDLSVDSALRNNGVYRYKQIALWSPANVNSHAAKLNTSPDRIYSEQWITQAGNLALRAEHFPDDSEKIRIDREYGILYHSPPEQVDDLKRISGVGPVLESKLNEIGVYQYKQIALWTTAHAHSFSSQLSFKDRVFRDRWIRQARELAEKSDGSFMD